MTHEGAGGPFHSDDKAELQALALSLGISALIALAIIFAIIASVMGWL